MKITRNVLLLGAILSISCQAFAGTGGDSTEVNEATTDMLPSEKAEPSHVDRNEGKDDEVHGERVEKKWFEDLRYSGYARMWAYYRDMEDYYNIPPAEGLTLPTNLTFGDGYEEPLLLFRIEANPSSKTWFQMEYFFDNRLLRSTANRTDENGRGAKVYRIFQFTGMQHTKIGTFKLIAGGGVNWYKLSPFTLWNFQYRDDMFERYPWEPEGNNFARYNAFYNVGDIPRDQRWGNRGTQGFILEATGLPAGFNASILYGKNENSGGFQSFNTAAPQNMLSGRVDRLFGPHRVGVNYFNQYGYDNASGEVIQDVVTIDDDSALVEVNRTSQMIVTVDGRFNFNGFSLFTELGGGSYLSPNYNGGFKENANLDDATLFKRKWDPTLFMEVDFDQELTYLPLKLTAYSIGKQVVNNTSTIFNTSIEEIKQGPDQPDEFNTTFFDGLVTEEGQYANNRRGLGLTVKKDISTFNFKVWYAVQQEIENLYDDERIVNGGRGANTITFPHKTNQLARSRFAFFERFVGPYDRLHSIYRRTFENVAITDTVVDYKKSFNNLELTMKQKFRVLNKEVILAFFGHYYSVQDKVKAFPLFDDEAFLRMYYGELMTFVSVHPKLTLVGFVALERNMGNDRTELADEDGNLITDATGNPVQSEEGKPLDQVGRGAGVGFDYDFASRASLHLRYRWYDHKDFNFTRDKFIGQEATVELKVFF